MIKASDAENRFHHRAELLDGTWCTESVVCGLERKWEFHIHLHGNESSVEHCNLVDIQHHSKHDNFIYIIYLGIYLVILENLQKTNSNL